MKKLNILAALLLLSAGNIPAQSWKWLQKIDGDYNQEIRCMAFTPEEDIVAAGYYNESAGVDFESGGKPGKSFAANQDSFPYSNYTLFIARYTPKGKLLWAINGYSAQGVYPIDIRCDKKGNILVCGSFCGSAIFNSADGKSTTVQGIKAHRERETSPHNYFIAKYDRDGKLLWVRRGLGENNLMAVQVCTDKKDNIYVRAYSYSGSVSIGEYTLLPKNEKGNGIYNMGLILVKYNAGGKEEWIARGGYFHVNDMRADDEGNIQVTGSYRENTSVMVTTGQVYHLETPGRDTVVSCVLHFNNRGELEKIKPFIWLNDGRILKHCSDAAGNQYVLVRYYAVHGGFGNDQVFSWKGNKLQVLGDDIFLLKYNAELQPQWMVHFSAGRYKYEAELVIDRKNNLIVSGWYGTTMNMIDASGKSSGLSSPLQTMFVSSFTSEGIFNWADNLGSAVRSGNFDLQMHLAVNSKNRVFVAGVSNVPFRLGDREVKIKGREGWNSPGWEKKIDYGEYADAFLACMDPEKPEDTPVAKDTLPPVAPLATGVGDSLPQIGFSRSTAFVPVAGDTLPPDVVVNNPLTDLLVYPNPVSNTSTGVTVEITLPEAVVLEWSLYDPTGKLLLYKKEAYAEGKALFSFSTTAFAPGMYQLIIVQGKTRTVRKIIVL